MSGVIFVVGVSQIGTRLGSAGCDGSERFMATLTERDMLAGSVGGVMGSMSVIGSHSMPEGSPC